VGDEELNRRVRVVDALRDPFEASIRVHVHVGAIHFAAASH